MFCIFVTGNKSHENTNMDSADINRYILTSTALNPKHTGFC